MPIRRLALVAAILVASCAVATPETKASFPVKGPLDARKDAVTAEVGKIDGVAQAAVADGALQVTLKEGKSIGLVAIAKALKAAAGDGGALEVDESKLALSGVFDLVAFTAADEGSYAEGACEGILEDAGAVSAKSVESPDEPKREGGDITVIRVTFTPKEGADPQMLETFREVFVSSLITAATKENGFGLVDVRWGAAGAK